MKNPVSENPLVHQTVSDTNSAVSMFMTGFIQVFDLIRGQPFTEEMQFMLDMSLRTPARALKQASEIGNQEGGEKPGE